MPKPSGTQPLYSPLDFVVVRAPLLPVDVYLSLRSEDDQFKLLNDPRVERALAAASPSLLSAIGRWRQGALTKKDAERLASRLLMYQIRMSTRPTPFGLFAGCAPAEWADQGDLRIHQTFGHTQTRPDLAWLIDLVLEAEAIPEVRRQLCLISNPLIQLESDRALLSESTPPDHSKSPVSIRATSVVKLAISLARNGIHAWDLAAGIAAASPSATSEKIDRLLTQLWDQRFLLTDLRPPLTTSSPAAYVFEKLAKIPQARHISDKLARLLQAATEWDQAEHGDSINAFREMLNCAGHPEDNSKEVPVQADMALSIYGRASSVIGREAAKAAELLLRLSPTPRGLSSLVAYRNAFIARYGLEREVSLPELTDPDRGLGNISAHGGAQVGPNPEKAVARSRELLRLACLALHSRQKVVDLSVATFKKLETSTPDERSCPLSLDLNILIAAKSESDIDAGEFNLVIGPNLGGWSAGRNFGRFAHLHPSGSDLLIQAARMEETHEADHIWAEVVYLPQKVRSANVSVRPAIRRYEVVFGVSPGVAPEYVIHPDELVVGVETDRFYVRWLPADKRVKLTSGHMLNHMGAPPMAQFLSQVGFDSQTPLISFDWGPAEGFPFLPRVQKGRIVLRPAEWRITKGADIRLDSDAVRAWRTEWDVPGHVCLTAGDNRLILDLDLRDQVQILLAEYKRLPEHQSLLLQEVLPSLDEAWIEGEEGRYYGEFTVPLLLRYYTGAKKRPAPGVGPADAPLSSGREYQPGSEWLYAKLYGRADDQNEVIGQCLRPFARNALAGGLIDSWFFLRYADPADHVRVRFHGDPERLRDLQFGNVCRWASGLIERGTLSRLAFEAYDPEIERFGGPAGMLLSEQIFHADSEAVADLTSVLAAKEWADQNRRILLFALTAHDLLLALGFDAHTALVWYKQHARESKELSVEYRKAKNDLRMVLSQPDQWLASQPGGEEIQLALSLRRGQIAPLLDQLLELAGSAASGQPVSSLAASYVHLHLNRLGAALYERKILNFLLRTCESLSRTGSYDGSSFQRGSADF
jgi:thiopeptide-type bacteriocin biosynthesis protein